MAGRRWTQEEMQYLEDKCGVFTVASIAKHLGRSFDSVNIKLNRMGLQGFEKATDLLTVNQIHFMLGVEHRTIYRWGSKNGLKIKRKGNYTVVDQRELIKFLKNNQDLWNAKRVKDDTIFLGEEWFIQKKRNDVLKKYNWTTSEEHRLQHLRHEGYSISEIAEKMERSESSIKYKIYGRKSKATIEEPEDIAWIQI